MGEASGPENQAWRTPASEVPQLNAAPHNDEPAATPAAGPARSFRFPRSHRIAHANTFDAVFASKMKKSRGPLTVYAMPNTLPHCRLGLSVGKRAGNAVARNSVKRALREAFRLVQHQLPKTASGHGYDIVVAAKPHQGLAHTDYQDLLLQLVAQCHTEWERRDRRAAKDLPGDGRQVP